MTERGLHYIGWRSSEAPTSSDPKGPLWRALTSAAGKITNEYLLSNPRWTYSSLSMAKGANIKELTMQGGVGGNLIWAWALKGGIAAKIGHSKKFNARAD